MRAIACLTASYDERGNQIAGAYFDEGANRCVTMRVSLALQRATTSTATDRRSLFRRGRANRSEAVMVLPDFTASYDERGNQIEVATFDEGGKPVQEMRAMPASCELR